MKKLLEKLVFFLPFCILGMGVYTGIATAACLPGYSGGTGICSLAPVGQFLQVSSSTTSSITWTTSPISSSATGTVTTTANTLGDMLWFDGTSWSEVPPNTNTSTQKFLSQTSSSQPSWQVSPAQGSLTYYLWNSSSSLPTTDKQLITTPTTTSNTFTSPAIASGTVVATYITNPGFPGLTFIPAGQYMCHIHTSETGGGTNFETCQFWEENASGTDITMIGETEPTPTLTTTKTEYTLVFANGNVYNTSSSASRIAVKIVSHTTAGTKTYSIYTGNADDSHISLPSNTVDATNFVPYTGATKNVDLGTFGITAGGLSTFTTTTTFPSGVWGSTGNVGIGTTSPSQLLTVGNNNQFTVSSAGLVTSGQITATAGNGVSAFYALTTSRSLGSGSSIYNANGLGLGTALGTSVLSIATTSNVGIGTTSPSSTLDVNGTTTIRQGLILKNVTSSILATDANGNAIASPMLLTIPWTIEYPTSTEDDSIFTFPATSTIKSVYCVNKTASDTVTFNLFYNTNRSIATSSASPVFSSYQTCTATTTPTLLTSFSSSTPATGSVLRFITSAASSTQFHFDINYTTP